MTPPKKTTTLDDIAKSLNVSKVTVSKALRDHPDIGMEMKRKVRETAARLSYKPNRIARNLSSRHTRTLGLVVPRVVHHFFTLAIEAIYEEAHRNNYEIIMMLSQEDESIQKQHIQTLLSMRVDGLLISLAEQTKDYSIFHELQAMSVPLVFFDRVPEEPVFTRIHCDDEGGAFELVSRAISSGFRNILHLGGPAYASLARARENGYQRAMKEGGLSVRESMILRRGFGFQDGYDAFLELCEEDRLPEMIFAVTYPVALGVCQAARERNVLIPDEVDLISFGDSSYNRYMNPSITCAHQPAAEMGIFAVKQLLGMIESPETPEPLDRVFPVSIIQNQTCIK